MSITWFDDESEKETTIKVMNFTRKYDFGSESSDEEITYEKLTETYILVYTQWKEAYMVREREKRKL